MTKLYTIGFTEKSAEQFFTLLSENGVKTIVDTRLNNVSQLAGFAKSSDLRYFAERVAGIGYEYIADFAPTKELLTAYRKGQLTWTDYQAAYLNLLERRHVREHYGAAQFDGCCFLCSEHLPHHCHRRLLAEYLARGDPSVEIIHLT